MLPGHKNSYNQAVTLSTPPCLYGFLPERSVQTIITLVGFWTLTSRQYLSSYQNGYQLVTMCTHGDFIVLPHWETRPPAPTPTHSSWHWAVPYSSNAERLARKQQLSIVKLWLNHGSNSWGSDSPIFQSERKMLYSFGHPMWSRQTGTQQRHSFTSNYWWPEFYT